MVCKSSACSLTAKPTNWPRPAYSPENLGDALSKTQIIRSKTLKAAVHHQNCWYARYDPESDDYYYENSVTYVSECI